MYEPFILYNDQFILMPFLLGENQQPASTPNTTNYRMERARR